MDGGAEEPAVQDVGTDSAYDLTPTLPAASGAPSPRALIAVGLAIAALLGVYALGRSGAAPAQASPVEPVAPTIAPTAVATPTAAPTPEPPPELVDLLGQGAVLAEFELGNRSRAVIWCRESVPGTQISSTLALIHIATSIRFGDQVVLYEELAKPWVPGGSGRRGRVLETEGLGAGNFAAPADDEADLEEVPDPVRCNSCAPERVTLGGGDVLVGSCVHGVPFGVGIVYVIAPPVLPGQSPLALHVSCGISTFRLDQDNTRLIVEGEAPLVRGLHEARFPFPAVSFERDAGRFVADDLELLDWNCEIERSSHLADKHLLRTEGPRSITYLSVDSAIGEIGVHGPMVLGLTTEQCSLLTRAWWGRPDLDEPSGAPIADLVGLAAPAGQADWFYACHRT